MSWVRKDPSSPHIPLAADEDLRSATESPAGDPRTVPPPCSLNKPIHNLDASPNLEANHLFSQSYPESDGAQVHRQAEDLPPCTESEEDDIETIRKKTRFTKQQSVASTINALRIAREAKETGKNTLAKLVNQSVMGLEKLVDIERRFDISKIHVKRVKDKQEELRQLNRSIFRPIVTGFNKETKRDVQEARLLQQYEREEREREQEVSDSHGRAKGYTENEHDNDDPKMAESGQNNGAYSGYVTNRSVKRKSYQVEATVSDNELEAEIDKNLIELNKASKGLKDLALTISQEVDNQNDRLSNRMVPKVNELDEDLRKGIRRFKHLAR